MGGSYTQAEAEMSVQDDHDTCMDVNLSGQPGNNDKLGYALLFEEVQWLVLEEGGIPFLQVHKVC